MAEKNTESTAVNELIQLVATAKPLPPDPDEDLMFKEPDRKSRKVSGPRPSGAGDIEPLPRARSPVGTQQGLPTVNQTIRAQPPAIRVSTAPPQRTVTIPPLPQSAATHKGFSSHAPLTLDDYNDDAEVTNPEPRAMTRPTAPGLAAPRTSASGPIAARVTKPSIPPPFPGGTPAALPTARASSPRPSLSATMDFQYPVVQHSPAQYPVVQPDMLPAIAQPEVAVEAPLALPSVSSRWSERDMSTDQVPKGNDWKSIAGKLIGPMIALVIVGIFVGGYFAFDGDGGKKKKAPKPAEGAKVTMPVTADEPSVAAASAEPPATNTEPAASADPAANAEAKAEPVKADPTAANAEAVKAEPAPAKAEPAPVAEPAPTKTKVEPAPAPTATGRPMLVDVRIDSNPSGATVNLVDRGKTTYLGTTPVSAAVDASRKYELVFSYENRATVVEALDPSTTKRVNVKLSREKRRSSSASTSTATRTAPALTASKIVEPTFDTEPTRSERPAKPEKAEPAGEGILMISSKPPCEIYVDGKPTGLTTPQREIKLSAGAHKITLVNAAEGIKKTISVQITADKPTKVIQDFMSGK